MAKGDRLPIEDDLAIRFMFSKYAHLADSGDAEGWADLFTEDASWTRVNSPSRDKGGSGQPAGTMTGRSQLAQMVVDTVHVRFNYLCRHQITDVHLACGDDPDSAIGLARALITDWTEGPGKISMVADYDLTFARTAGGWKISSIACTLLPG